MQHRGRSIPFTPDDTTVSVFDWVMCGTAGVVIINYKDAPDIDISTQIVADVWYPMFDAIRIRATGTTATGLVVA